MNTKYTAPEAMQIKQDTETSGNVPEDNHQSELQGSVERGYSNVVDRQLFQTADAVVTVKICDEEYKNIEETVSIDYTVGDNVSLQSMEESNNSEILFQESIQALNNPSASSGARNVVLLRCQESKPTISGNQTYEEPTSNVVNCDQEDPVLKLVKINRESDNVQCTVNSSHVCSTFIRKDMIFLSLEPTVNQSFVCRFCNAIFTSEWQLHGHVKMHTKVEQNRIELYVCTVCKVPFSEKRKLVILLNKRDETLYSDPLDPKPLRFVNITHPLNKASYICFFCNKSFRKQRYLNIHARVHTGYKPYGCQICSRSFSCNKYLQVHMHIHTEYKTYHCEICSKPFSCERYLQTHVKFVHTDEKPYLCKICSRPFRCKQYLRRHLKMIHTDIKPYHCKICSRSFRSKGNLRSHVAIHTELKPFNCEICSRAFPSKYSLRAHASVHTGYKPYRCEMCSQSFALKKTLQNHLYVHLGYKPYRCGTCSLSFSQEISLRKHAKVHKGDTP